MAALTPAAEVENQNMRTQSLVLMATACWLGMAGVSRAQSLADFARHERAKQASQSKPAKVFTNDNITRSTAMEQTSGPASETASAATAPKAPEASASEPGTSAASQASKAPEPKKEAEDKVKTKEYWESKFAAARSAVDRADEELRLSEDELNLAQMNAARELDPAKQAELKRDVSAKQSAADAKREADEKAKQALETVKKDFEASGAPKDWLPAEEEKQ